MGLWLARILFLALLAPSLVLGEVLQTFSVIEGAPEGTLLGTIGQSGPGGQQQSLPSPPYLIVPLPGSYPGSTAAADSDLSIDQNTGAIRNKRVLDREHTAEYKLSAIPLSGGESIQVVIQVEDVNDNSPKFPQDEITLNIPENTPKGTRRKLEPAYDADLGVYATQTYEIQSGNEDGAFLLSVGSRDSKLDLIVNENLDRERLEKYSLKIIALDGGQPPKTGTLTVRVNVQDLNDNPPVFNRQRYFTSVSEDLPVGGSVFKVSATDEDAGDNGQVHYAINRRQSDKEHFFRIDEKSGLIVLDKQLDLDHNPVHEIVVVARDGGSVPQETSAFVTVRLTNGRYEGSNSNNIVNSFPNSPVISEPSQKKNIVLTYFNGRDKVPEDIEVGVAFARITVPGRSRGLDPFQVELLQTERAFQVVRNSSGVFLATAKQLNYAKRSSYQLTVEFHNPVEPSERFRDSIVIGVEDHNDHKPAFERAVYEASVDESVEPGTSVIQVRARDQDKGSNGEISYSLRYSETDGAQHADWFQLDEKTGVVSTQTFLDCEYESNPRVIIVASDGGYPSLSSTATLSVSIKDVNDNQPLFKKAFYEAKLLESTRVGACFLQVQATDMDCGQNSIVTYQIKEASASRMFQVKKDNGQICLGQQLDHESQEVYGFTVIATDRGGLSTSTMIKVDVSDINDNFPKFAPEEYVAKIRSRFPENINIVTVKAHDPDSGPAGQVHYKIISGNTGEQFELDSTTGHIRLAKPLGATRRFQLVIDATDGEGLQALSTAKVSIFVDDDDLTFRMPQYSFDVYEDVSPYSEIGQVEAKTFSSPANMEIYDSNVASYISLDPSSGRLRTEARMDHERHSDIILNVRFEEPSQRRESYCQVIIKILDVNDNAPEFGFTSAMATVSEDLSVGTVIYPVSATDADSGKNGIVRYSLVSNPGQYFEINRNTGSVTLLKQLDYEQQAEHKLVVEAEDLGSPKLASKLKLTVQVYDINDNSPKFEQSEYTVDLSETHPLNTPIYTIKAKDSDSGRNGKISYSLSSNPFISVLQNTGVLILKQPLDHEAKKELNLQLTARDHGVPSLESTVPVVFQISDRNDNSPRFERNHYKFSVSENLPEGTFVGAVIALDKDEGANGDIEYDFKTPVDSFLIQKDTGRISTSKTLDRELIERYELVVEAIDFGKPRRSSQTVIQILVRDVNDNAPHLVEPQDGVLFVAKDAVGVGSLVGRLVADDVDAGQTRISFQVLDSDPAISIDSSGDVRLMQGLDGRSEVASRVRISESNTTPSLSTEEVIRIIPVATEDLPRQVGKKSKSIVIARSARLGSKVGSLAATASKRSVYFVKNYLSLPLVVDKKSGEIYVTGKLDHVAGSNHRFEVEVRSVSGEEAPRTVEVAVELQDEADQGLHFPQNPTEISVPESTLVGTGILDLQTMMENSNGTKSNKRFDLIHQLPAEVFGLDSGKLILSQPLDYEQNMEYLLTVRGFSGERHSADLTVLINVEDVNDNAPKFLSSSEITLPADTPLDTAFTRILVTDDDSGANGEYTLSITAGNYDNTFLLNSVTQELSAVKIPSSSAYTLTIRATDKGTPALTTEQSLRVNIAFSEDSTPRFEKAVYYTQIAENSSPDTKVITLSLNMGVYSSKTFVYTLLKGNEHFYVDRLSGEVKTVSALDREEEEEHALIVSVQDSSNAGITDTAIVYVTVNDINDNSPTFGTNCKDISIPENSQHSFVHAFVASDADSGKNGDITYSLNSDHAEFRIEKDTGKLYSAPLDREEEAEYQLEILAVDSGLGRRTAKCEITIKVLDKNDNEPSFAQSIYSASVKEDIPLGTQVLTVQAFDTDEGLNAEIEYSIENASQWAFSIDKRTGKITNTELLDRESVDEYHFDVVATDRGLETVRSSSTKVRIIVTDANDHQPEFVEYPFYVNMSATPSSGVPLLRLEAVDPDAGPNGQLTYNLVRPDQREHFQLSPEAGLLTVASSDITWEPGTVETLEVAVSDAGNPPRSSTGLVEIKIEGGPAINLVFQEAYTAEVQENPQIGQDVLQVLAVRSDGRRQNVIYNFLRGNELGAFEINSNNGLIRVRDSSAIDYESQREFNLTVSGVGLGDDELTAYTTCLIRVQNMNDKAPKFAGDVYSAKILEGSPKGSTITVLSAIDEDEPEKKGENLKYEILDGNVDGAFGMDPNRPGAVITNIVLDREIKDYYELTISATDSGQPPLVGLTQLVVRVLDINDNKPNFGAIRPITVRRGTKPGSVLMALRANDIDLAPPVTYKLERPNDFFIIDTYTGQLQLLVEPAPNVANATHFQVIASDGKFETKAQVSVSFLEDEDNCRPRFTEPLYKFFVSANDTFPKNIGTVAALSCNEIEYDIPRKDRSLFGMFSNGTVVMNRLPREEITSFLLTVTDEISGHKTSTVVTVNQNAKAKTPVDWDEAGPDTLQLTLDDADRPIEVLKTNAKETNPGLFFTMSKNAFFEVDSSTGEIYNVLHKSGKIPSSLQTEVSVSVHRLGDESLAKSKSLSVIASREVTAWLSQDTFLKSEVSVSLSENTSPGAKIDICPHSAKRANPFVKILSGNEAQVFTFQEHTLQLVLAKALDYEVEKEYALVLKLGSASKFSLCTVTVRVENVNDYTPFFPLSHFVTSVAENAPAGTEIEAPPVVDLDKDDSLTFWTDSSQVFVDPQTGALTTYISFNYEAEAKHHFTVYANDSAGHEAHCAIELLVESIDEYPPLFDQQNYYFNVQGLAQVGDVIGQVKATDKDQGADGYVTYAFAVPNKYFSVDPTRGVITVSRALDSDLFSQSRRKKRALRELRLVINAKSRQPQSLETSTLVTISIEDSILPVAVDSDGTKNLLLGILLGFALFLIAVSVVVFWLCKQKLDAKKEARKRATNLASAGEVNMSMELSSSSDALSRFPPQYSEIVSDYEQAKIKTNRSEISEKSHRSASSGRGSVEDVDEEVDVEIRMINEGSFLPPDSAFATNARDEADAGAATEESVQAEEYLARLGIDIRKPPNLNASQNTANSHMESHMHGFDPAYAHSAAGSSIYNRIPEDALSEKSSILNAKQAHNHSLIYGSKGQPSIAGSLSSIVHSEEELAGSYNWDYLLDWGPQYQPLAHVFKEISKLKDDNSQKAAEAAAEATPLEAILSVSATSGSGAAGSLAASSSLAAYGISRNPHTSHLVAPPRSSRSPISHEGLASSALSPSFHPALSPLATKSPSVSPLSAPLHRPGQNTQHRL